MTGRDSIRSKGLHSSLLGGSTWSLASMLLGHASAGHRQWGNSISHLLLGTSCPYSSSARI